MTGTQTLTHEFVEYVPRELKDNVLYVSIPYATVIHKCCCGCGLQVVTPLSPSQWSLTFDGRTISLHPSIGNWHFPCKSHYWIKQNRVAWARQWHAQEIAAVQRQDAAALAHQFSRDESSAQHHVAADKPRGSRIGRFFKGLFGG